MQNNRAQYNNYQKKTYTNAGSGNNGGQAKLKSTKKDGTILEVILNNQNLVLKGFYDNRINGWKLFPYYDKTKQNPQFNQPKQAQTFDSSFDDELPESEKQWSKSDATDFNPEEYDRELI